MPVFFSDAFNDVTIHFDTFMKAVALHEHLRAAGLTGLTFSAPRALTVAELCTVHARAYVDAVAVGEPLDLAASNGVDWDPGLLTAAATSSGGVVEAARHVLEHGGFAGSLSSGLHHARRGAGAGYCTFNGLALAAFAARRAGAARVLVLDLDAHCGGGTASLIEGTTGIEQVDVSVSSYDEYRSTEQARLTLSGGAAYLGDVEAALDAIAAPGSIDLVLYNAGMDAHAEAGGSSRGVSTEALAAREQMVFGWAASHGLPVAWVPAGGYTSGGFTLDEVCGLHRLTVEAALHHLGLAA
jgi:acetoin utilization deacetylase AcuC-like enzyme